MTPASDLYRVLFEQSPDAILVIDPETMCAVDCNDRTLELLGYSREEFATVRVVDYEALESPDQVRRRMDSLGGREIEEFETRWRTRAGELRDIFLSARLVSQGGRNYFHVVARDITESRRNEDRLRRSGERYRAVVEDQTEVITRFGPDGTFTFVNDVYCRLFGKDQAEFLGHPWQPQVFPEDLPWVEEGLEALTPENPVVVIENRVMAANGQVRWMQFVNRGFFDNGTLVEIQSVGRDVTERKEYEQRLAASEDRYRTLFQNMAKGVFCRRADGTLDDVNPAALDLFGLSREEFMALKPDDPRWRPVRGDGTEYRPGEVPSQQALRTGVPVRNAIYGIFNPKRQDNVWLSVDAIPLFRPGEERPWQVLVTLGDITERRREEERLRLLTDCFIGFSPDAEANINRITATIGRIMNADCALYNRLEGELLCSVGQWHTPPDYQAEDLAAGHLCHDVICGPERGAQVIRHLERTPFAQSDPNVSRYGLQTYIGTPVFWGKEAVGSLCVVFASDVEPAKADLAFLELAASAVAVEEARWRSEAALEQREEFIRAILDSVDEGFLVIDRDFRIVTCNRAFHLAVDGESEAIVGRHCYEVSHHASRPCFEEGENCAVKETFATGLPQAATHRHENADGSVRYVEIKAFPLRDEAGRVTSAIETINDVTARKQLADEQLKSQKLEAVGTLAGGIAHDFNNLLQGGFGYLSLARINLARPEKAAELLEQAERALNQSVSLTGQLLTFAKGGQPVIGCFDLEPVLHDAVRFALSGTRSDFQLTADGPLWPVAADQGQIGQVFQNIVINANEAMPGGGKLDIRLENLELDEGRHPGLPRGGRFVRIAVRDTGVGIQPGHLERIFDPYFTTKQQGSGLGLATAYSIVRNHGGIIEVRSTPGQGSCFLVYLPACENPPEEADATPPPETGRLGRILVMDDEEVVRSVAREMLEALGHEVVVAADGTEAVTRYREALEKEQPFDAVILDLTVKGGMGGEEAIRRLQALDPRVVAIVSSGYAESSVVAEYHAHGFAASLGKPYRIDRLQEALARVLEAAPDPEG